jgi:hypothetical protein
VAVRGRDAFGAKETAPGGYLLVLMVEPWSLAASGWNHPCSAGIFSAVSILRARRSFITMSELGDGGRSSGDAYAHTIFVTSQHDGRLIGSLAILVSDRRIAHLRSQGDYRARLYGPHFGRRDRSSLGFAWFGPLCARD